MNLSKNSTEKPPVMWFVVEREDFGGMASAWMTRDEALARFTRYVVRAQNLGEAYTPFQRNRRLAVIGPNVHTRAADDDAVLYPMPDDEAEDPLLYGEVALRAVLEPEEYAVLVQKPVASALLES